MYEQFLRHVTRERCAVGKTIDIRELIGPRRYLSLCVNLASNELQAFAVQSSTRSASFGVYFYPPRQSYYHVELIRSGRAAATFEKSPKVVHY
jgi:hypothetical protein